ncbi:hypothetical protein PG999_005571 [Apiospora kogelbergensis]|uniref:Tc1-like transposase DDE domain-containing protein n=1 Tax=Apiospora kogelbergensis TaxID=1337665 RepID=A0AAW0R2H5_9PEZI
MLKTLLEHLVEKPDLYQDEMAVYLFDEFDALVATSCISRALAAAGWSRKVARRIAKERNADLRDHYLHKLSSFPQFHRDRRHQILPAYSQDGVELVRIYPGFTDSIIFEDYIEQLLQHCGRWPAPKSVLVMDNASIHHPDQISQLCEEAGVKLLLSPSILSGP